MKNLDSSSNVEISNNDLDEFRKQWKAEISQQKNKKEQIIQESSVTSPSKIPSQPLEHLKETEEEEINDFIPETYENEEIKRNKALEIYVMAVTKEQEGNLSEALKYYRQALKIDSHVDNLYRKYVQNTATDQKIGSLEFSKIFSEHLEEHREDYVNGSKNNSNSITHQDDIKKRDRRESRSKYQNSDSKKHDEEEDQLTTLIESFRDMQLTLEPLIPYNPVHIAKLPNESIISILEQMVMVGDITSLERFGLVCKKFLLLSREPSLWKYLCEKVYRYINLECNESNKLLAKDVELLYANDWRRMYIERPRIRLDGVYISTCHYLRPGAAENAWHQPIHLITYYRYLRFYSDGTCILLLTTTEPINIVKYFTPEYKSKGFMKGTWKLNDDQILTISAIDRESPKFTFCLSFDLKSTSIGKNNKLAWIVYTSINNQTDEYTEIGLRNEKNYLFSKVQNNI
ncbi:F-box protein [Gigaspora margarita]|uniref:F-box only protein 9 n=1 Tax=Gigaspora margarita TaxID=4874 RepID=A0A8H4B4Z1_GIGMA|nr:F-box protein [Gigaspora margarita]